MAVPADRVVLTAGMVTFASTFSESVLPESLGGQGKMPSARLLFGTSLAFIGLSILADIAPGIASPLSVAVAFTALTYYGVPLMDNYFSGEQPKPKKDN